VHKFLVGKYALWIFGDSAFLSSANELWDKLIADAKERSLLFSLKAGEHEQHKTKQRSGSVSGRSVSLCFDFQRNTCQRGENCRFPHVLESASLAPPPPPSPMPPGGFSGVRATNDRRGVCYDFQRKQCTRGETCRFAHE
jgi:hypothetical protein